MRCQGEQKGANLKNTDALFDSVANGETINANFFRLTNSVNLNKETISLGV